MGRGRVFPALWAAQRSRKHSWPVTLIRFVLQVIPIPGMELTLGKAVPPSWNRIEWRLLATASRTRLIRNESIQWASTPTSVCPACRALRVGMGVVGQLCFRQRGLADSAGKTDVPLEKPTTGGCYVVRTDAARDAENHRGRDPGRSQKNQDTPRHTAGGWSRSRTPVPLALPDAFSFSHIQPLWRFPCPLSLLSPPII